MLGTFVAGRYSSTIQYPSASALSLGIMEEGYHLSWSKKVDLIDKTDAYGDTPIEGFYQGIAMHLNAVAKEWLPAVVTSMQPYNGWAGTGADTFDLGTIGQAETDKAGILVLTATAGVPAAASPASMTFTYALQDESEVNLLLGPKHRVMALSFRIWPYSSSGIKLFSST